MTAAEFIQCLVTTYRDKDDHETISIGHWVLPGVRHPDLPDFYADVGVTVGDLRKMSAE